MKSMKSTCAYCVPLTDWKGEVKYLWARGVDYIAQLPGNEDPRKWYDKFPGLVEASDAEAEEKAPIEMMIAKDNWKWMPVRQASRLTERQDNAKIRDKRLLARTQIKKRLLLLPPGSWLELRSGKGCCYSYAWRPVKLSLQRKTMRMDTLREGSAGILWLPRECWTKRRRRMRNG
jgi:hypothetical protein